MGSIREADDHRARRTAQVRSQRGRALKRIPRVQGRTPTRIQLQLSPTILALTV
jgi:hypothetical protein